MSDMLTPKDQKEEKKNSGFVKVLSEPLSKYGWPTWLVYLMAIFGLIYILNPGAGLIELIPDIVPIIGNLDEGVAVMLVLAGIVEALEGHRYRVKTKDKKETKTTNKSE